MTLAMSHSGMTEQGTREQIRVKEEVLSCPELPQEVGRGVLPPHSEQWRVRQTHSGGWRHRSGVGRMQQGGDPMGMEDSVSST